MNFNYCDKSTFNRNAKKAILFSMLGCSLIFLFQLIFGLFLPYPDDEIIGIFVDIGVYCCSIVLPFVIVKRLFSSSLKHNIKHSYRKLAPKNPFIYITGAIGVGYLVNLLITVLFPDFSEAFKMEESPLPETAYGKALYFVLISVFPAFIEEWAFRGVILKNLLPYGKNGAILISSLLFGIVHIDPPRVIFATIFGITLAVCYEYTRNLTIPIIIHFLNNSISVIVQFNKDNLVIVGVFSLLIYVFIGLGIYALVFYIRKGVKHHTVTFDKPSLTGYKLTATKFLQYTLINYGIIPLGLLYSIFFSLYYLI